MEKIEALEKDTYYKLIKNDFVFIDNTENKKYSESDVQRMQSIATSDMLDASIGLSLLNDKFKLFETDKEFEELISKEINEVCNILEAKKNNKNRDKIDELIKTYKNAEKLVGNFVAWNNDLEKSKEVKSTICFKVDEINILPKDSLDIKKKDCWENDLDSDIKYRSNGEFLSDLTDSTDYILSCLEQDKEEISGIEYIDTTKLVKMTNDEIIAFEDELKKNIQKS